MLAHRGKQFEEENAYARLCDGTLGSGVQIWIPAGSGK